MYAYELSAARVAEHFTRGSGLRRNQPPTASFTLHHEHRRERQPAPPVIPTAPSPATPGTGATTRRRHRSDQLHTYATAGTYPITLTVTDNQGATATVDQPSHRHRTPPTAARRRVHLTATSPTVERQRHRLHRPRRHDRLLRLELGRQHARGTGRPRPHLRRRRHLPDHPHRHRQPGRHRRHDHPGHRHPTAQLALDSFDPHRRQRLRHGGRRRNLERHVPSSCRSTAAAGVVRLSAGHRPLCVPLRGLGDRCRRVGRISPTSREPAAGSTSRWWCAGRTHRLPPQGPHPRHRLTLYLAAPSAAPRRGSRADDARPRAPVRPDPAPAHPGDGTTDTLQGKAWVDAQPSRPPGTSPRPMPPLLSRPPAPSGSTPTCPGRRRTLR